MPASPRDEFARSIAFANLQFPEHFRVADLARQDMNSAARGTAAFTPYVNELARVLRYPGLRLPKERYPSELSLHAIFRPLYGFGSCDEVLASQRTIRKMLVDLLAADVALLQSEVGSVVLSVDAVALTLPSPARRIPKTRGRPHRGLLQTIQMSLAYVPQPGHRTLVYGIGLGVSANLLNRLNTCERCDRFILGRTDRRVRFCAELECRMPHHTPAHDAPTSAARHQRTRRSRLAKWERFERRDLKPAMNDVKTSAGVRERRRVLTVLRSAVRDGHALLDQCFPRASGKARETAVAHLSAASALLRAHKREQK